MMVMPSTYNEYPSVISKAIRGDQHTHVHTQ